MLIKCPECGKEISDQSDKCINCGYPIKKHTNCIINGTEYDLAFMLDKSYSIVYKIRDLVQISGCDLGHAKPIVEQIVKTETIPSVLSLPKKQVEEEKVRCPKCGSTLITTGARGANYMFGFIGASQTVNRCAKCGYKWKP